MMVKWFVEKVPGRFLLLARAINFVLLALLLSWPYGWLTFTRMRITNLVPTISIIFQNVFQILLFYCHCIYRKILDIISISYIHQ